MNYVKFGKILSLFLVPVMVMVNSFSFVAFAEGELRPIGISLMSHKVTPGFEMKFQIFETLNARQNVNRGEPQQWPPDYLMDLEYNLEYPNGVWGIHRVFTINNFGILPNNTYSFTVPDAAGWYRVTVKNGFGVEFASEIFEVAQEPFLVVDRIIRPGDNVVLKIYDENGDLWDVDDWGNREGQYTLDVFSIGGAGFVTHAGLGMENNGDHPVTDNENGTYTYAAGDVEKDFYIRFSRGTGLSYVELDSTSYDVYGEPVGPDEDQNDDNDSDDEEDDNNDNEVLVPVDVDDGDDDDEEDICDPGEYCPEEDEDDADDDESSGNSGFDFSLNTAALARLPNFSFVNWKSKIILSEGFSYDDYDFEADPYELRQGQFDCSDLEGHWGKKLIRDLLKNSMYPVEVSDGDKHLCRPDKDVTRERLMAWLIFVFYPELANEAADLNFASAENPYDDLDADFGSYVLMATKAGIVHGQNGCAKKKGVNCKFGNGSTVNRAEILKMAIEASGIIFSVAELKEKYPEKDPIKMFVDVKNDKDWFYEYLYFATANNVIQGIQVGDGKYEAAMGKGLTFSQAAKIISLIAALK